MNTLDINQIPSQFLLMKDLITREDRLGELLDYLSKEMITLEDEQDWLEHKDLRRYSIEAGLQPINIRDSERTAEKHYVRITVLC